MHKAILFPDLDRSTENSALISKLSPSCACLGDQGTNGGGGGPRWSRGTGPPRSSAAAASHVSSRCDSDYHRDRVSSQNRRLIVIRSCHILTESIPDENASSRPVNVFV
ncbi:hypothetical protein ANO11243_044210 [Dothideomycetidae sp. 11243]|nr:hypothetical protein ANO11243_044210 [fungal sp. No.11243]